MVEEKAKRRGMTKANKKETENSDGWTLENAYRQLIASIDHVNYCKEKQNLIDFPTARVIFSLLYKSLTSKDVAASFLVLSIKI